MDIGKKISGYRRQSGLTQKQLADIPEGIDAGELPGHISAFLRKIPERDANIFIARYYYFEDVKRIAAEHGIRANNAGIILFRMRAKLTEFLKEEIHNE